MAHAVTTCLLPLLPLLAMFGSGRLHDNLAAFVSLLLLGCFMAIALLLLAQRHHMLEFKASARWGPFSRWVLSCEFRSVPADPSHLPQRPRA